MLIVLFLRLGGLDRDRLNRKSPYRTRLIFADPVRSAKHSLPLGCRDASHLPSTQWDRSLRSVIKEHRALAADDSNDRRERNIMLSLYHGNPKGLAVVRDSIDSIDAVGLGFGSVGARLPFGHRDI